MRLIDQDAAACVAADEAGGQRPGSARDDTGVVYVAVVGVEPEPDAWVKTEARFQGGDGDERRRITGKTGDQTAEAPDHGRVRLGREKCHARGQSEPSGAPG